MCTISTNSWAGVVLINCHSAASSLPVLPLPQSQITKMGFTLHKCKLRSQNLYVNDQMLFYLGINGCDGYHHCIMIPVLFSPSFRAESTPSKNLQIGNFWLLLWPSTPRCRWELSFQVLLGNPDKLMTGFWRNPWFAMEWEAWESHQLKL